MRKCDRSTLLITFRCSRRTFIYSCAQDKSEKSENISTTNGMIEIHDLATGNKSNGLVQHSESGNKINDSTVNGQVNAAFDHSHDNLDDTMIILDATSKIKPSLNDEIPIAAAAAVAVAVTAVEQK